MAGADQHQPVPDLRHPEGPRSAGIVGGPRRRHGTLRARAIRHPPPRTPTSSPSPAARCCWSRTSSALPGTPLRRRLPRRVRRLPLPTPSRQEYTKSIRRFVRPDDPTSTPSSSERPRTSAPATRSERPAGALRRTGPRRRRAGRRLHPRGRHLDGPHHHRPLRHHAAGRSGRDRNLQAGFQHLPLGHDVLLVGGPTGELDARARRHGLPGAQRRRHGRGALHSLLQRGPGHPIRSRRTARRQRRRMVAALSGCAVPRDPRRIDGAALLLRQRDGGPAGDRPRGVHLRPRRHRRTDARRLHVRRHRITRTESGRATYHPRPPPTASSA